MVATKFIEADHVEGLVFVESALLADDVSAGFGGKELDGCHVKINFISRETKMTLMVR